MILDIEDERGLLDDEARALMQRCADSAQNTEGVALPLYAFVRIVDDDEIQIINREQRSKDMSTDVLSFPTVNYPQGKTAGGCERLLRREYDPEMGASLLGDIIISMDHVRAQAKEYGHSIQRETGYLLTHGLFHLMGYDHMTDADKPVMRAMEERALCAIGLTREENAVTDEKLLDMAVELELVNKSGSWFSVKGERIGQGRDNAKQYIMDHPEIAEELEAKVREHLKQVNQSRSKGKAAGKAVDISADDFDED